ncbi:MAG: DUF5343 domain-containing protein [Methylotenera sp.]|nr:DUF5343 domain-containing protein [Methylotenera sp.]
MANLPYAQITNTLEAMLNKIKTASVPEKFSQDFVSSKLMMKGGNGRAVIPFVKKMGLVSADGTPTDRYKEFRNPSKSGIAIAAAIRELYEPLFEMNEFVYDLDANRLKGLIVEATGLEASSTVVKKILSTFQALRKQADFEAVSSKKAEEEFQNEPRSSESLPNTPIYHQSQNQPATSSEGINLSYTINLNLPATKDIEVFNAIFKSLKQHLIQD